MIRHVQAHGARRKRYGLRFHVLCSGLTGLLLEEHLVQRGFCRPLGRGLWTTILCQRGGDLTKPDLISASSIPAPGPTACTQGRSACVRPQGLQLQRAMAKVRLCELDVQRVWAKTGPTNTENKAPLVHRNRMVITVVGSFPP